MQFNVLKTDTPRTRPRPASRTTSENSVAISPRKSPRQKKKEYGRLQQTDWSSNWSSRATSEDYSLRRSILPVAHVGGQPPPQSFQTCSWQPRRRRIQPHWESRPRPRLLPSRVLLRVRKACSGAHSAVEKRALVSMQRTRKSQLCRSVQVLGPASGTPALNPLKRRLTADNCRRPRLLRPQ